MDQTRRVVVIVMDGVGVGELPDADDYGDQGSNTLGNLARHKKGLTLPNLQRWGLGNIIEIQGISPTKTPRASFGKMRETSPGKDSTSGHWELMGCPLVEPFPVYPDGFPPEVIQLFTEVAGMPPLGNVAASGTEIIEELGKEHLKTGRPIVYTSADSVFQVAIHVKVWPIEKLHELCAKMREKLTAPHEIARVIARPFFGKPGQFIRSPSRKDYTVAPPNPTIMDHLKTAGFPVVGIGKISDLFAGQGLTRSKPSKGLDICLEEILDTMDQVDQGLIFANLGEFDTLWGHRNDPDGFAKGLEQLDEWIPEFEETLRPGCDIAILTADHGCDPTTPSTDHSREYVPLLVWSGESPGVDLGVRETFSDVAATIETFLDIEIGMPGTSFLPLLPGAVIKDEAGSDEPPAGVHEEPSPEEPAEVRNLFFSVLEDEIALSKEEIEASWETQKERGVFAGNHLVEIGKLSHTDLIELLGLVLVRWLDQAGLYDADVKRAFEKRTITIFLGDELVDNGLIPEEELVSFYVRACGIPYIQLSGHDVPSETSLLLPREAAVAAGVLPMEKVEDMVTVATARPADTKLVEEVSEWTGCRVRTVVSMRGQLLEALGKTYVESPPQVAEPAEEADQEKADSEPVEVTAEKEIPTEQPKEPTPPEPEGREPVPSEPPAETTEATPVAPSAAEHPEEEAQGEAIPGKEMEALRQAAKEASEHAYAPHSKLKIGAAVLTDDGEVFTGSNVENDSYGLSMCAERVAIYKAVSSGKRGIKALAVVNETVDHLRPCGACLQVIHQFGPKTILVFESAGGVIETAHLSDLLPDAFFLIQEDH